MSGYTGKTWNKVNTSKTNVQRFNNAGRAVYNNKSKANLQSALENRRAFVPNVNQLKSKIQDTGDNHPKKAVMVMGHGNEGWKPRVPIEEGDDIQTKIKKLKDLVPDMIRVPKGSIVVVKSHPGDITLDSDTTPEYINFISKENEQIILDPIKYIDDITSLFGSVSIFREGDMCPNISHYYFSSFDNDTYYRLEPSGSVIIPMDHSLSREDLEKYIRERMDFPKEMTIKEYKQKDPDGVKFMTMFKLHRSIKTGENTMLKQFEKMFKENEDMTIGELFKMAGNSYASQEDIFNKIPDTITYAFNCRFIDNHEHYVPETVRLGLQSKNNLKGIIDFSLPEGMKQKRNETNVSTNLFRTNLRNTKQNNSLKLALTRKRVKNMAGEIKQEIAESINQRRLGALSLAKGNKTRNRNMSKLISNYRNKFNRSLRNNSYKHTINELEKANPGIKEKFMSDYIDTMRVYPLENSYKQLYSLRDEYPNLREKINNKLNEISTVIYNEKGGLINIYLDDNGFDTEEIAKTRVSDLIYIDLNKYPELYLFLKQKASTAPPKASTRDSLFSRKHF